LIKERKEREGKMTGQETRAIDCMAQHVRAFFHQSKSEGKADFAEPCEKCKFVAECSYDWTAIMEPILKYGTNVKIMAPMGRTHR
jgi:hypothetical protein